MSENLTSSRPWYSPDTPNSFTDIPAEFDNIKPSDVSMTPNAEYEENQYYAEAQNVLSGSPYDGTVSGARKQMYGASHIAQALVIKGSTPRRNQTGAEQEYGKATFCTKAEYDCEVLQKFRLYSPGGLDDGSIKHNPMTVLIVETIGANPERPHDREIDVIVLQDYLSFHQYFGYPLVTKDFVHSLSKGSFIKAGTILQDSPNKHADGNYAQGIGLNTVFASFHPVAEDGVILSEEAVPWLETYKYERRTISWGSTHYPRNTYGDKDNIKIHPDIGEYIREDGLLMALGSYDPNFSAVEMSKNGLMNIGYTHDKLIYVPPGRGKVVDIRYRHDAAQSINSPAVCNTQAHKYDDAARRFHQSILDFHNTVLRKRFGNKIRTSHRYNQFVRNAFSVCQERAPRQRGQETEKVQKIYRGSPMDDFTVEITVEYRTTPKVGYKITDLVGGKGTIVKIWPKEWMPVDEAGNRAHIIMDEIATINRMNVGRLYEQYVNACSRDHVKRLCALFDLEPPTVLGPRLGGRTLNMAQRMAVTNRVKAKEPQLMKWWEDFKKLIGYVNPVTRHEYYETQVDGNDQLIAEHIVDMIEDGIFHFHPSIAAPELPEMLRNLRRDFQAEKSRLTFRGVDGTYKTTYKSILVGDVYFLLLEKTGDDWNAVSSGRLQGIGILSQINNQDKHSSPWRAQSIRVWGETETSITTAYCGWFTMAVIMDRNNNINTHRDMVMDVLDAEYPTNIEFAAKERAFQLGEAKPLQLTNHMAMCAGWGFTYHPYVETCPKPSAFTFVNNIKNDITELKL